MRSGIGDGVIALFRFGAVMLAIFVPLGLWKMIDISIWLFRHIKVSIS